jgi:uncharacterized OsmC-like protein
MGTQREIADAMRRATTVYGRRPDRGMHDDAPATAVWQGGLRITAFHPSGLHMDSDMPVELGGTGDCVSPGWLFRAGIAACSATVIAMLAASEGIALDDLEIVVSSRSDTRGVLGMRDASGAPVRPGADMLGMDIRVHAHGVDAPRLRALVEEALRRSPIQDAVTRPAPVQVRILAGEAAAP